MDQCMSFNIDTDNYEAFIEKLREPLPRLSHLGIGVLTAQPGPLRWLDVELIAGYHKIILRLDQRTLYVCGYRRNDDSHFWEFHDYSPLIPGSQSLSYFGSYAGGFDIAPVVPEDIPLDCHQLVGLAGTADIERCELRLGYMMLREAIITLAVTKDPCFYIKKSAKSLLVMIQMITEAARIERIGKHIVQNWGDPKRITIEMLELENAWGTPHSLDVEAFSRMRTLVSIDYVRLKSINGKSHVQLRGFVKVKDLFGKYVIYSRSSDDPESKGPGDYISLTDPSIPIYGEEAFTIFVSLWDHDNEIAEGIIRWDPISFEFFDPSLSEYGVPQVEDVSGDCGMVSVQYTVVQFALGATVSIELFNIDSASTNVYGTIKAKIASLEYQSWRMLFDKSEGEYERVPHREWQRIPLTRPTLLAPANSYITIEADLRVLPHCNLIARGSVQFIPTYGTLPTKIITGRCGSMKVSITCSMLVDANQ